MTCDPERLSYYLDGELDPDETRELQQHLTTCERCAADLAAYRRLDEEIGRLGHERAPGELRRAIYRRVEQRERAHRRAGLRGALFSPAFPLTAAFVIVAGAVVAWRMLPPGAAPVMTAAFAVQESPESLDGLRVELVFDRPVAPDSVAEAVKIDPPLPVTRRVLDNKVELIPQVPVEAGSRYRVTVSNVRDQRGNAQSEPVVLSLTAGATVSVVQESAPAPPRPAATATAAPLAEAVPTLRATATAPPAPVATPTAAPRVAQDMSPTPLPATPSASPPARSAPAQAAAAVPTPAVPPVVRSGAPEQRVATAVGSPAAVAEEPGPSQPTAVAAVGSLVAIAPRVEQPAQPTAAPTATAAASPTLLDANPGLGARLGAAREAERPVQLGEQTFQGGAMLWRADTNQILVLMRANGQWLPFPSTWRTGEVLAPAGPRPPGTFEPLRGFGKVWREQPVVKNQLGWPVYEERQANGTIQAFAHGTLLRTSYRVAYVLLDDGTWRTVPDPRR